MAPEKLAHGKITEETGADRAAIDAIVAILGARCMAMGLAPTMAATRGDISRWWMSRATQSPQPLFEPGDWRVEAVGSWIESFLRGDASVSIAWKDGRPSLVNEQGA
jgi:hypothetical protein